MSNNVLDIEVVFPLVLLQAEAVNLLVEVSAHHSVQNFV